MSCKSPSTCTSTCTSTSRYCQPVPLHSILRDIYHLWTLCFLLLLPASFYQSIMLCLTLGFFLSALVATAWSTGTTFSPKGAKCQDYTIPLTITSENRPWIGPRWTDNYGFIDFLSIATSRPSAGFPSPVGNPVNQTASYNISATFCTPEKPGKHSKTVLLATHGLGFDKR